MFDINSVSKRYFAIKFENGLEIKVEPPKLGAIKKITALAKVRNEEAMDDLVEAVKMILSKNKTRYKVTDEIIDEIDFDQLNEILTAYFEWLAKTKNTPN